MTLVTAEDVIIAAQTCYLNMDHSGLWDKVNPCNADIMALMVQFQSLKSQQIKNTIALAVSV